MTPGPSLSITPADQLLHSSLNIYIIIYLVKHPKLKSYISPWDLYFFPPSQIIEQASGRVSLSCLCDVQGSHFHATSPLLTSRK